MVNYEAMPRQELINELEAWERKFEASVQREAEIECRKIRNGYLSREVEKQVYSAECHIKRKERELDNRKSEYKEAEIMFLHNLNSDLETRLNLVEDMVEADGATESYLKMVFPNIWDKLLRRKKKK